MGSLVCLVTTSVPSPSEFGNFSRLAQSILNAVAELFHDLGIVWFGLAYSLNQPQSDGMFAEYVATILQTEAAYPAGNFHLNDYPYLKIAYDLPKKPIVVENVETDHRLEFKYLLTNPETEKWKAVIIIPLQTGDDLQGLILGNGVTATVSNTSIDCSFTVGMASYEMYNSGVDYQTLYDATEPQIILPGETLTFTINVPDCAAQIDLFTGELLSSLYLERYGDRLIQALLVNQDSPCQLAETEVCTVGQISVVGITPNTNVSGIRYIEARFATDPVAGLPPFTGPSEVIFTLNGPNGLVQTNRELRPPYYFLGNEDSVLNGWDSNQYLGGEYVLTVEAYQGSERICQSAEIPFTIAYPLPIQPANLATLGSLTQPPIQPTYSWDYDSNALWYQVVLNGASGTVFNIWFDASLICDDTRCSIEPDEQLQNGSYNWWVGGWNPAGQTWSDKTFTVDISEPVQPSNLMTINFESPPPVLPTYSWDVDLNVLWYQVVLNGAVSGNIFNTWYEASQICDNTTCTIIPTNQLTNDTYTWWVGGWNSTAQTWNTGAGFTVNIPLPVVPTNITTSGIYNQPTYSWDRDINALWYQVVLNNSGGASIFNTWYDASLICNDTTCSITPVNVFSDGSYTLYIGGWNSTGQTWNVGENIAITAP